jgi:hypothetical protein
MYREVNDLYLTPRIMTGDEAQTQGGCVTYEQHHDAITPLGMTRSGVSDSNNAN